MSMTLKKSVFLALKPASRALDGACNELNNLPTGDTSRVDQAYEAIATALPNRSDRTFSVSQFVDAVFDVVYPSPEACGVYKKRSLADALRYVEQEAKAA